MESPGRLLAPVASSNTVERMTISQEAAQWLEQLSWSQIPSEVVDETKLRILDVLGVMLAAKPLDVVERARTAALANDQGDEGLIVGFAGKASLPTATFVNGVMAAALEFDDTHIESAIHPTAAPVAVGFAAAASLGASGKELITAILTASELTCRLGKIGPRFHEVLFHPTGVFGTFGAAYSLAKLLGLDAHRTANSVGLCGSMAAGSMGSWDDGSSAKSLQVGLAAAAGARAVGLAKHGLTGPASIFESRFGFFRSHVQSSDVEFRFSALTEGLGREWEVQNIASKAYPSAFPMHPYVDAVLHLRRVHWFDVGQIDNIVCQVSEFTMAGVCEPHDQKVRPKTAWHARISLQHIVAEALVTGLIDKSAFTCRNLTDPRINSLADKVRCVVDPALSERDRSGASVKIVLSDGRELRHAIEDMRGTRNNPISSEDYIKKFRANAGGSVADGIIDRTIAQVLELERIDDVTALLTQLQPGAQ